MKALVFTIIFFMTFCLSGCLYLFSPSISNSLSSDDLFYKYSGKKMKLLRPMNLWQWGNSYSLNEIEDKASDIDFPSEHEFYCHLPVGTPIILTDCYCSKDYSFFFTTKAIINVNGKIILSNINKEIEFEYKWGENGYLYRAPWEEKNFPKMRYIKKCQ
ncbi:hypothetical protein DENIS_4454 [Desulfonema ishimotonii]|uniref:Uncharacterized protein n=1 Tax=Desulfonema ishimotonii TaxID=45657 RepID=A0A401G2K3_9BACT|nr:hypothetical protein [Desulfonema ishimotonii]GBC63460.1 hypothetical protein DENIS_4454 [Desulfonema ishimotonii]